MRSYRIVRYGAPLERSDRNTPEPGGSEVLLRVLACGVCHTDVHHRQGYYEFGEGKKLEIGAYQRLPITLGHEVVGEVAALGPAAEGVSVGDRRVVFPWIGCGECDVCGDGRETLCLKPRFIGTRVDGGYSDFVMVPHARYLVDYAGVPEDLACTYGCSGLTAYSALGKAVRFADGGALVIVGAGGLGLMATRIARAVWNAEPVVADIDDRKLEAAKEAGAAHIVNCNGEGAAKRVIEITGGGAWAAIDFVGAPTSSRFGMDVLRKGGGLISVGLFGGAISLPLPLLPLRAMSIVGSFVGTLGEMEELMALARDGKIAPIPIEARALDRANETIDDVQAGRVIGRAVLVP